MVRRSHSQLAALAALAALSAAAGAWPAAARADVLTLRLDPYLGLNHDRVEDAAGLRALDTDSLLIGQRYRLGLTLTPYPLLRLSGSLFLDDQQIWTRPRGEPEGHLHAQRWTGSGQASFGSPLFGGVLGYGRQQLSSEATGLVRAGSVRETFDGRVTLRPADLPSASLSVQHQVQYSTPARTSDRVTDGLRFDTDYDPSRNLSLHYGYRVERSQDRAHDVVGVDQIHFARVGWSDTFLENRLNASADYNSSLRFASVTAGGAGGTVTTQALPTGGLSKTLAFSDTQERVTLLGNPALVDAVIGSSAGIDLGWGRSATTDTALRAMGAEFAPVVDQPAVNLVHVWVDQRLPPEVVAALPWTAWESTDNLTWTPVPVTGVVVFGELDSRFEIPIRASTARFLRVDARPLPLGVTTDQRYSTILVTEVQFLVVKALPPGTSKTDQLSGSLSGSLRALLLRSPDLVYSLAVQLSHANRPLAGIWSVTNGLSFSHRLSPTVTTAAQVMRSDDGGTGKQHNASSRWGASLAWDPIPTFGGSANYSGQVVEAADGLTLSNSANLSARAALYRGVELTVASTGGISRTPNDRLTRSTDLFTGLSLIPNQALSTTLTYSLRYGTSSGGGQPVAEQRGSRLDATAAYNPFPALSLAATFARVLTGAIPSNQATFNAGFSPFRDGALQVFTGYFATVDTSSDTRTRNGTVGLRWNWRGGARLEASFVDSAELAPAIDHYTRSVFVNLALPLL